MPTIYDDEDQPDFPFPEWDRYEPMGYLGEGFFGLVFKARDRELDRPVALKFLHSRDPELVAALHREAQAQARLDHPNICRIYEVGSHGGRPYLAMQFVAGRPLDACLPELGLDAFVGLLADIAETLDQAHRAGLAHRDLKANNILVEALPAGGFRPCIVDFGQATLDLDPLDRDPGDLWSLGEMAYTLLGGAPSPAGPSSLERQAPGAAPRPSLHALRREIPADLAAILARCLELDPGRGYGSAAELARDLRGWLARRRNPRSSGGPRWRRLGLVAALAVAAGWALVRIPRAGTAAVPLEALRQELAGLRQAIQTDSERLARLEDQLGRAQSAAERTRLAAEIATVKAALARHRTSLEALEARLPGQTPAPPPPAAPPPAAPAKPAAVRTGSAPAAEQSAVLLERVVPAYPMELLEARKDLPDPFEVPVDVRIDASGRALEARAPEAVPAMLRARALEAALGSRYAPAKSAGEPIESWLRVTYRFARAQVEGGQEVPAGNRGVRVAQLAPLAVNADQYERLRALAAAASLVVLVRIDAAGKAVAIRPEVPLPWDLERPVQEAVRRSRFLPGMAGGMPREGWITVSFPLR